MKLDILKVEVLLILGNYSIFWSLWKKTSKIFFEEVPIHGVVGDSEDEESSKSDDGSGDDEACYVNGGLFLSRFVQGRIFSYNSSDSGNQSDNVTKTSKS